jgi:hypothetical protein
VELGEDGPKGDDACERDLRLDGATAPSDVNGPDREDVIISDLSQVVHVKLEHLKFRRRMSRRGQVAEPPLAVSKS